MSVFAASLHTHRRTPGSGAVKRLCSLILTLTMGFTGLAAQAQTATPNEPPPQNQRLTQVTAPRGDAKSLQHAGAPVAAAGTHNCWCRITCKSDQNGQQFSSPDSNPTHGTTLGSAFSWPITATKHDQCSQRCLDHQNSIAQNLSQQGKLCKTGTCRGLSWIGTEMGGSRETIDNTSFDNSNQSFCQTPPLPGLAQACCAPFDGAGVVKLFDIKKLPPADFSTPYSVLYQPDPTFDAKMNAFAAYAGTVKPDCNPSVVTYRIFNKATNITLASFTATYTGSGAPVMSPPMGAGGVIPGVLLPPNYATYVLTATGGCSGFTAAECKPRGFEFVVGVSSFKLAAGTATNGEGEVTFKVDGVPVNRDRR